MNGTTPDGWTPDDAFIDYAGQNGVSESGAHSGSYALVIGNDDVPSQPLSTLSQTFADVSGQSYTVSFYAYDEGANRDANAYLEVSAGSQSMTLPDTAASYPQTPYTFTFTGTGSDTLQIAAQTNPNEWVIDDVSVDGPAVSTVSAAPEPSTWALMLLGVGGVGGALRQAKRKRGLMTGDALAV